jgi:aminoglycoside phosphotransferase family enzyme/predicted kinase
MSDRALHDREPEQQEALGEQDEHARRAAGRRSARERASDGRRESAASSEPGEASTVTPATAHGAAGGGAMEPDAPAELRETHTGVVVLLGDLALKFKKPVDVGFLDYTSLERRFEACRREVMLNRRLAPDVYRGWASIVDSEDRVVEHLVVMRRLPDSARLATLVRNGGDVLVPLRQVARRIAAFHADAPPVRDPGVVDASWLGGLWSSAVATVREHPDVVPAGLTDDIERLSGEYLRGRGPLLGRRRAEGCIVDGHGDLMTEDIFCLEDGPRILDCLEFDDRLRTVDRIDDAAFLAMDLERIGAPSLGTLFLEWYREFSADTSPSSLIDHYLAYRAMVRSKVACIRIDQGGERARAEARRCTAMALSHLEQAAPVLVLVGGAPGTGKSTLALGLADALGMACLQSDRIRKELAALPPGVTAPSSYESGLYSADRSAEVYQELLSRSGRLLSLGESVVVDATWAAPAARARAAGLAADCSALLVELHCRLDDETADERLRRRGGTRDPGTGVVSDADPEIAARIRSTFAPWPSAHAVDTARPPGIAVRTSCEVVRPLDTRVVLTRGSRMEPD